MDLLNRTIRLGLVAFVVSLAVAKPAQLPAVFDPDPTLPGAGKLQGETWSRESPSASLWLTRIDDETRNGFLHRRSGLSVDFFRPAPDREGGGFLAFHVLVENRTDLRLVFQPQACRLQTSWKDFQAPLDLPTIEALFAMHGRPLPDGIERLRSAIIDGEVVLSPGEKRDGLFIFHAVEPTTKKFQVDIGATLGSGDPFGFSAFYKKRKKCRRAASTERRRPRRSVRTWRAGSRYCDGNPA